MKKALPRHIWDFIGAPLRLALFPQNWLPPLGLTTLEDERLSEVFPLVRGRLLDIGAGQNTLVKRYGNGIGVDVFDWESGALVLEDCSRLPFPDSSFDTVTFVACLNHIPNRSEVLIEAARVLRHGGRLIITMIDPILGEVGHKIWWYGEHNERGGMKEGEVGGMWSRDVIRLCNQAGFKLQMHKRFLYRLNQCFMFSKVSVQQTDRRD
jgi:SAM-dependent methyltransferase